MPIWSHIYSKLKTIEAEWGGFEEEIGAGELLMMRIRTLTMYTEQVGGLRHVPSSCPLPWVGEIISFVRGVRKSANLMERQGW